MDRRPLRSGRGEQKTQERPLPDNPFASVTGLYRRRSEAGSAWPERKRHLPGRLMHLLLLMAVFAGALILFLGSGRSGAYLSDEDTVPGNRITIIEATSTPEPTETPTATATAEAGVGEDIVQEQEPTPCPADAPEGCETPQPAPTATPEAACNMDDPACLDQLPGMMETMMSPMLTQMPGISEPTAPPEDDSLVELTSTAQPGGEGEDPTASTDTTSGDGDVLTPTPSTGGTQVNDTP